MERSKLQFQVVINGKKELDDIFKLVKQIQEKNKLELKLDMSNSISSIKQLEGVIKSVNENLRQLNTTDFTSNIIKGINEAKAQIKDFEKAVQQTKSKTINIIDKDSLQNNLEDVKKQINNFMKNELNIKPNTKLGKELVQEIESDLAKADFKSIKDKIGEIAVTKADKDEDRNISANRRQFIENNKEMYEYFRKQKISLRNIDIDPEALKEIKASLRGVISFPKNGGLPLDSMLVEAREMGKRFGLTIAENAEDGLKDIANWINQYRGIKKGETIPSNIRLLSGDEYNQIKEQGIKSADILLEKLQEIGVIKTKINETPLVSEKDNSVINKQQEVINRLNQSMSQFSSTSTRSMNDTANKLQQRVTEILSSGKELTGVKLFANPADNTLETAVLTYKNGLNQVVKETYGWINAEDQVKAKGKEVEQIFAKIGNIRILDNIEKREQQVDSLAKKAEQMATSLMKLGGSNLFDLNKSGINASIDKIEKLDYNNINKTSVALKEIENTVNNLNKNAKDINAINTNFQIMKNHLEGLKNTNSSVFSSLDLTNVKNLEGSIASITNTLKNGGTVDKSTISKTIGAIDKEVIKLTSDFENIIQRRTQFNSILNSISSANMGQGARQATQDIINKLGNNKNENAQFKDKINQLKDVDNAINKVKEQFASLDKTYLNSTKEGQDFVKKLQSSINSFKVTTPKEQIKSMADTLNNLEKNNKNIERANKALGTYESKFNKLNSNYGNLFKDEKNESLNNALNEYKAQINKLNSLKGKAVGGEFIDSYAIINQIQKVKNAYNDLYNKTKVANKQTDASGNGISDSMVAKINRVTQAYKELNKTKLNPSFLKDLEKQIKSLDGNTSPEKIKELQELLTGKMGIGRNSDKFTQLENKMKDMVSNYKNLQKNFSEGLGDEKNKDSVEAYNQALQKLKATMRDLYNGKSVPQNVISERLKEASRASKELNRNLGNTVTTNKSFLSTLGNIASRLGIYTSMAIVVRKLFQEFKEGIQTVIKVEDAMVSLRRVYDMTDSQAKKFQSTLMNTATSLAEDGSTFINSVTEYRKLGYTIQESQKLAQTTTKFNLAGDINNLDEATTDVIATLKGFKLQADDVVSVTDKMNTVSNEYAISAQDIATIVRQNSAAMKAAGNDINEAIALGTVAQEVQQNASKVGTALKTISQRLRGVKTDGEEISPTLRKEVMEYANGFDILKDDGSFKSTYEIFKGIGKEWNNMTSMQQAKLGQDLFGKQNLVTGYAILQNADKLDKVLESLGESSGSVDKEFNRYLDSTSAKLVQLKDSIAQAWTDTISSDTTKGFVEVLQKLVDTFGNLRGVVLLATTALLAFKGEAITDLVTKMASAVTSGTALTKVLGKIKGVVASNPLGVAVVAITTLVGLLGQAKTSTDKFNDSMGDFADTQNKISSSKETDDLVKQYKDLQTKINDKSLDKGAIESNRQELQKVQEQLADQFPSLVDGFDSAGNAIVTNLDKVIKKQKELKKELASDTKGEIKSAYKALNESGFGDRIQDAKDAFNGIPYFEADRWVYKNTWNKTPDKGKNFYNTQTDRYQFYLAYEKQGKTLSEEAQKNKKEIKQQLEDYNKMVEEAYKNGYDLKGVKYYDLSTGKATDANKYFKKQEEDAKKAKEAADELTQKVIQLNNQGLNAKQIADKFGISVDKVNELLGITDEEATEAANSIESLANAFSKACDKVSLTQDILKELNNENNPNGVLSMDTINRIFSSGDNELIAALGDKSTFKGVVENKQKQYIDERSQSYNDVITEAQKELGLAKETANETGKTAKNKKESAKATKESNKEESKKNKSDNKKKSSKAKEENEDKKSSNNKKKATKEEQKEDNKQDKNKKKRDKEEKKRSKEKAKIATDSAKKIKKANKDLYNNSAKLYSQDKRKQKRAEDSKRKTASNNLKTSKKNIQSSYKSMSGYYNKDAKNKLKAEKNKYKNDKSGLRAMLTNSKNSFQTLNQHYNNDAKNKKSSETKKKKASRNAMTSILSKTVDFFQQLSNMYLTDADFFIKCQQAKAQARIDAENAEAEAGGPEGFNPGIQSALSGKSLPGQSKKTKKKKGKKSKKKSNPVQAGNFVQPDWDNSLDNVGIGNDDNFADGGSGEGGGGSDTPEQEEPETYEEANVKLKDYIDNTKKLNTLIKDMAHNQSILNDKIDESYGKAKVDYRERYITEIKNEMIYTQQLIDLQRSNASRDRATLMSKGVRFGQNGVMQNLDDVYALKVAQINALPETTTDQNTANRKKALKEELDALKELAEAYDEERENIQSLQESLESLSKSRKDAYEAMASEYETAESNMASAIKNKFDTIYEDASKALDKVKDKLQKTFDKENYEDELKQLQDDLLELQTRLEDAYASKDYLEAQSIQKEYDDKQKELTDKIRSHNKDEALNKISDEQTKLSDEKEEQTKAENISKLINQGISQGFVEIQGEIYTSDQLFKDYVSNTVEGWTSQKMALDEYLKSLTTCAEYSRSLMEIYSGLGILSNSNVKGIENWGVVPYNPSKQITDYYQRLTRGKDNVKSMITFNKPLVEIGKVSSNNYEAVKDEITNTVYTAIQNAINK